MTTKECKKLEEDLMNNGYVYDIKNPGGSFQMLKRFDYHGKIYQGRCYVTYNFDKKGRGGYEVRTICEIAILKKYLYRVQIVFTGNNASTYVEDAMKDFMDVKPKEDE